MSARVLLIILVAGSLGHAARAVAQKAPPDLSGGWHVSAETIAPLTRIMASSDPPFRAEVIAQLRTAMAEFLRHGGKDYCRPWQLNGSGSYTNPFEDTLEFLSAPARITMLSDLGMIRYIHLRPVSEDLLPEYSDAGYSRGRWQGDTLVVETTHLDPTARFPMPIPGAPALGKDARIVEYIRLQDPQTLTIRTVLTAPELLSRPLEITMRYLRERDYVPIPNQFCIDGDRLTEAGSGRARFDLTPPPGL